MATERQNAPAPPLTEPRRVANTFFQRIASDFRTGTPSGCPSNWLDSSPLADFLLASPCPRDGQVESVRPSWRRIASPRRRIENRMQVFVARERGRCHEYFSGPNRNGRRDMESSSPANRPRGKGSRQRNAIASPAGSSSSSEIVSAAKVPVTGLNTPPHAPREGADLPVSSLSQISFRQNKRGPDGVPCR